MKIGELSRQTGVATSAIRFYEQEHLLPRATRRSGHRIFDESSLSQLVLVQLAQDAGFTLAEIRELVTRFGQDRWRRLAQRKLREIQTAAERLRLMRSLLEELLNCECPDVEFCGRVIQRRVPAGRRPRTKVLSSRLSRRRPAPSRQTVLRQGQRDSRIG